MAFIKLDRKLLSWEWFNDPNTLSVWIYLLLNASYEDNEYKGVKVPKGSLITGRYKIAKSTGLTDRQVRTALEHLKATKEIKIQPAYKPTNKTPTKAPKGGSVITLVKWAHYQGQQENNAYKSAYKPTNKSTTTKEIKEIKNIIGPNDNTPFSPPSIEEIKEYCSTRGNDIDAEYFYDYYTANGWSKVKDWKAVIRIWEKKEEENRKDDVWF